MPRPTDPSCPYVSRGGLKLAAALDAFDLDIAGSVCADLGASTGGFTDCLLQRGAAKVYSVDTCYGQLAWKLRNDPRIIVLERTNALHLDPAPYLARDGRPIDLVTIDLGWTPQRLAIPAALRWRPRWIITLIKPHYEQSAQNAAPGSPAPGSFAGHGSETSRGGTGIWPVDQPLPVPPPEVPRGVPRPCRPCSVPPRKPQPGRRGLILDPAEARRVVHGVLDAMPALGVRVLGRLRSPILGGGGRGRAGNVEHLALLEPCDSEAR